MLKAQYGAGRAALAVVMILAFSDVAVRTELATAAPPKRPYVLAGNVPNDVATFHTFDIEEVFSNADGSVQFIELRESVGANGHHHFDGNQLTSSANVFTFPNDLPDSATANRSVLIATAAFVALPGAVTPDFIIPNRFFEVTGDTISVFEAQTNTMVDTFVFGAPPCPCDGDVDNNGVVNILDGACIDVCKRNGDCSCCLSSCDVNCDGAVDAGDIGDDVIVDPSAWLCLFQGGATESCCAPRGACCDTATAICADGVLEVDCTGAMLTWSVDLSCAQVACDPPPTGACCNLDFGTCTEGVLAMDCTGANQQWSEGLSCAAAACPAPPTGACCNVGNGQCQDDVTEVDCTGTDFVWTGSTLCSAVSCSVPPQNPCPCDADVDNNGVVNVLDGACIDVCKNNGTCSCCLSSCDVNCDGVVDAGDVGDDILNDPTPWLCQFSGGTPSTCCPSPTAVSSPIPPNGACCNIGNGQCHDDVAEVDCTGIKLVWTALTVCSEVSCLDTFLPTDGALSLNSDGTTGVNSPTNFAGEMGSVNVDPSIPTMSRSSLVVMMLLLVTAAVAITRKRRLGVSPST